MKSIVFFNNKGGVGKTTLICNVAAYLSLELDKKVLVVDADPQCNATSYCLSDEKLDELYLTDKRDTIESFLKPVRRGTGYLEKRISPIKTDNFGFDLIPGDPLLALSEDSLASDWSEAIVGKYRGLQTTFVFSHLSYLYDDYDFIFFDVGPSLGALNRAILISSDYFTIPMSVDTFSLMAIKNIKTSLINWRDNISRGLSIYEKYEGDGDSFYIKDKEMKWKLFFIGYVMQQYRAKTVRGKKVQVKSFEKIARKIPTIIKSDISDEFSISKDLVPKLGEIENMNSLIPMSQLAHTPVFSLKGIDGVVGAHFAKVNDAKKYIVIYVKSY
ncbi:ParA family protein [Xenorhabdus kozodoii]|uniref:CobQ/CobB/MinD/ParA family protein n=1 Tax=Xenorhabdus kozodoii TaxID=351676 RepID=A0A2D0LD01_9GAMM|nr:AAA family ATPase [Xenorhabdus kozodoii]PHM73576.1 CobQ/CobB/MinD/ParA family protein [Xenorhabdus kozodoii]